MTLWGYTARRTQEYDIVGTTERYRGFIEH